jgi:GTP pyrophosphokinase
MLLVSLLTGSTLGAPAMASLTDPERIDALATSLEVAPSLLARGLAERQRTLAERPDGALAAETLALVTPLADRLGLARERADLEDESFRQLDPEAWSLLVHELPPAPDVEVLVSDTEALLLTHGIAGVVTGRAKSLYSLHQKMSRKGVAAAAIMDRVGVRVRVADEADCYRVVDVLHSHHAAVPAEQDDYIASPKASGYRSLHTVVQAEGGVAEFQVRTHEMHAEAESGPAAHWRYKLSA